MSRISRRSDRVSEPGCSDPSDDVVSALKKKVIIPNRAGLHARPISRFVEIASKYRSQLQVVCNGQTVDGKSIIQLMTLAAGCGTEIELVSEGDDAEQLLDSLCELVSSGFDEA